MQKVMQVYETLLNYVTDSTPIVELPVYEMNISSTPASATDQTLTRTSLNIFDYTTSTIGKYINSSGQEVNSDASPNMRLNHSDYISIIGGNNYTIKAESDGFSVQTIAFCWYNGSTLMSRSTETIPINQIGYTVNKMAPSGADRMIINYFTSNQQTVMVNEGSTSLPFEPYGSITVTNQNMRFSGSNLSYLFETWSEVPHVCTQEGSLLQSDCVFTELTGDNPFWWIGDTTWGSWIGTEPEDWSEDWWMYYKLVTREPDQWGNPRVRQYFPVTKATHSSWSGNQPTYNGWWAKNIPENPAKKLMRIFTSKAGGSYGLSCTGGTTNSLYPDSFISLNRVGGFAPTSSITQTPESNFPCAAMFHNQYFHSCWGDSDTAGQYLGYMGKNGFGNVTVLQNQIFILVHFTYGPDDTDFYGYALMEMSDDTFSAVPTKIQIVAFSEEFWGDSITPYIPPEPTDNWGPDSTSAGGDGTFDYESDNRGTNDGTYISNLFGPGGAGRIAAVNGIVNNGGFNIYEIDRIAVPAIISQLYSDDFISRFHNNVFNPLEAILCYQLIPTRFVQYTTSPATKADLTAGGFNISGHIAGNPQFKIIDSICTSHIGSISFEKFFGAFPDFAPYTQITLHLPYIGDIEIDPNTVMYGELAVTYACDVISGNVCAWVWVNDKDGNCTFLYSGTGNCSFTVPLVNQSSTGSALGKIVVGAGGLAAGLASGNVFSAAGGALALTSGLASIGERQTHIHGTFSGNVSVLQDTECYVHIQRAHWSNPHDYKTLNGIPSNISGTLTSLECLGFTKCSSIEINADDFNATEAEMTEIESLLKSGIYINEP